MTIDRLETLEVDAAQRRARAALPSGLPADRVHQDARQQAVLALRERDAPPHVDQ